MNYEEYTEHDCTASAEDGCQACEDWQGQQQVANDIKFDEHKELYDRNREDLKVLKSHEIQFRLIEKALLKAKASGKKSIKIK